MNIIFYLIYFLALLGVSTLILLNQRIWKKDLTKLAKILSVVLVSLFFVNIFLPDLFAWRGIPGERTGILESYPNETFHLGPSKEWIDAFLDPNGTTRVNEIIHAIARVGFAIGPISIPFAIFYKKPQITRVVAFIVLPFSILNSALYFQYIGYMTSSLAPSVFGEASRVVLQNPIFRSVWFGALNLIQTALAVYVTVINKEHLSFKGVKDVLLFVAIALAFVFTNMPIYTAQHLFHTYSNVILTMGYPGHIGFMIFVAAETVALYFIFRKQSDENKYILLLIMAFSLLFQYNTFFKTDGVINASRWPFQLCNIAGGFLVVTLLTRSEKMFHFTLVVNSLGALIAIAICDSTFNTGILYCMNIHYMVEHINVLVTPVLAGLLRVFKPLKKEDVKHVIIGFAIYWATVLVVGTILCAQQGPNDPTGFFDGVNFLFMFNKEASVRLVGFVGPLFDAKVAIGNASLYLVQPIILIVFEALCVGVYFAFYSFLKERKTK